MSLSLREAREKGRLGEFISQEEARGVDPAPAADLDRALAVAVKPRRSEDRTSRFSSGAGA